MLISVLDCFRRALPAGAAHTLAPEDLQDLGESLGSVLSASSNSLQKASGDSSHGLEALGAARRPLLEAAGEIPEDEDWNNPEAVDAALERLCRNLGPL